jgi:hypothetical protein
MRTLVGAGRAGTGPAPAGAVADLIDLAVAAAVPRHPVTFNEGHEQPALAQVAMRLAGGRLAWPASRCTWSASASPVVTMTVDDIRALITALGDLRDVIRDAGTAEKAAIYDQLDLKVTFKPGEAKLSGGVNSL